MFSKRKFIFHERSVHLIFVTLPSVSLKISVVYILKGNCAQIRAHVEILHGERVDRIELSRVSKFDAVHPFLRVLHIYRSKTQFRGKYCTSRIAVNGLKHALQFYIFVDCWLNSEGA